MQIWSGMRAPCVHRCHRIATLWSAGACCRFRAVKRPVLAGEQQGRRRAVRLCRTSRLTETECSDKSPHPKGLAMLELVLALPILLFIMALIINYGTVAAWKVRGNSVARLAAWEARWPRSGATDPRPRYWPAAASMGSPDQGNVAGMDDSRVELPVARGPLPSAQVNSELFDPTRGLRQGSASLTRDYPLLHKLGTYTLRADTWLIDDKWQYPRTGLGNNWQRRIPVLYALAEAPASLVNAYVQSVLAIAHAPFAAQLRPLDNDPDFIYYGMLFGWGGPPDFYPRVQSICTTDRSLADRSVANLIDRIQGKTRPRIPSVAEVMAHSFLSLYQRALAAFQAILKQQNPPAPATMVALAQSQIPELQAKISILTKFLQTLRASRGK
jgi:hypothetical protein